MEDRETPYVRKYEESKTTPIMMATVPHVTSGSGLRKFQADGLLFDRVYMHYNLCHRATAHLQLNILLLLLLTCLVLQHHLT